MSAQLGGHGVETSRPEGCHVVTAGGGGALAAVEAKMPLTMEGLAGATRSAEASVCVAGHKFCSQHSPHPGIADIGTSCDKPTSASHSSVQEACGSVCRVFDVKLCEARPVGICV